MMPDVLDFYEHPKFGPVMRQADARLAECNSRLRAIRKLFRLAWWERVRLVEMGRYGDA